MIEINNLTKFLVDKKYFSTVAKKVLSGENRSKENISLAFVGKKEMQKINKKFRKKNKPTDVLSFSAQGGPASGWEYSKNFLGEIVICPEVVKENVSLREISHRETKKIKSDFEGEMKKVFIHGILHLLGYDHEKSKKQEIIMEQKQTNYLLKIK